MKAVLRMKFEDSMYNKNSDSKNISEETYQQRDIERATQKFKMKRIINDIFLGEQVLADQKMIYGK